MGPNKGQWRHIGLSDCYILFWQLHYIYTQDMSTLSVSKKVTKDDLLRESLYPSFALRPVPDRPIVTEPGIGPNVQLDQGFGIFTKNEMKWNESGFRPPLCTYRLNWARTSWGWWDDWDDTVLQTQDSKFEPWRSEAEHATSRSRRLPTILTFTRGWGRNIFVSFKPPRPGTEPRTLAWRAAVLTTTLGPPPLLKINWQL